MKGAMGDTVELGEIFAGSLLFLPLMVLITVIICVFPELSLWLPAMMSK
jgi:TRAP-type mannitol/chloroaromatic compound transport system permease large subunit